MINLERRKNIKKFGLVLFGIIMFRFMNIKGMFDSDEKKNIYSPDGELRVVIS